MRFIFIGMVGLFALGVVACTLIGVWLVVEQHQRITNSRPVPATVQSSEIITQSGKRDGGTTYVPKVQYTYSLNGETFTCDRVFPLISNVSQDRAHEVRKGFPDGAAATAYVDSRDPAKAFLLHEYSFLPYAFCLMSLFVGIFATWAVTSFLFKLYRPRPNTLALYWTAVTLVWCATSIPLLWHYYQVSIEPRSTFVIVTGAIVTSFTALPTGQAVKYFWRARTARP